MATDRLPVMQRLVVAESREERVAALDKLKAFRLRQWTTRPTPR